MSLIGVRRKRCRGFSWKSSWSANIECATKQESGLPSQALGLSSWKGIRRSSLSEIFITCMQSELLPLVLSTTRWGGLACGENCQQYDMQSLVYKNLLRLYDYTYWWTQIRMHIFDLFVSTLQCSFYSVAKSVARDCLISPRFVEAKTTWARRKYNGCLNNTHLNLWHKMSQAYTAKHLK